jgi:threonine dehydratase
MQTPNFHDVLEARRRIRPYLARTPMYSYPAINELIGTSVYIKDDWTPVRIGA